jgi:hypothetical protein
MLGRSLSPVKLATAIVLLGVLLQVYVLYSDYLSPWGRKIWDLRARTALERSGFLSPWFGAERTEFLSFVRENTSSDAVLLFTEKSGPYSWRPLLQYFLFPRTIVHCTDASLAACIESDLGDGGFVVRPEGGPQPEGIPLSARFVEYRAEDRTGLYQLSAHSGSEEPATGIP